MEMSMSRNCLNPQEFIDYVSREVVCSRMIGLEGKIVPIQVHLDDDDDIE